MLCRAFGFSGPEAVKGIVIAGGMGSRVYPMTASTSKCLLPIYSKPMVYYPVSVLMMAEIRDFLLISRPQDLPAYKRLFGDGSDWGMSIAYAEQADPRGGIAEAFLIGKKFVGSSRCALALGDNVFIGNGFRRILRRAVRNETGATVFALQVADPQRFGVITFDATGQPVRIDEKPPDPGSNWAITGLYFFDNSVVEIVGQLEPGARGELEISDVNQAYLQMGKLRVERLGRGIAWYDAGTPESLFQAANHVRSIERDQRQSVSVPEEIALSNGWIDCSQMIRLGRLRGNSDYGRHLERIGHEMSGG